MGESNKLSVPNTLETSEGAVNRCLDKAEGRMTRTAQIAYISSYSCLRHRTADERMIGKILHRLKSVVCIARRTVRVLVVRLERRRQSAHLLHIHMRILTLSVFRHRCQFVAENALGEPMLLESCRHRQQTTDNDCPGSKGTLSSLSCIVTTRSRLGIHLKEMTSEMRENIACVISESYRSLRCQVPQFLP
jgi:hypothetical protein